MHYKIGVKEVKGLNAHARLARNCIMKCFVSGISVEQQDVFRRRYKSCLLESIFKFAPQRVVLFEGPFVKLYADRDLDKITEKEIYSPISTA